MKIYIAGPMREYEDFNFPAFHEAAKTLREGGHEVINPAEMDEALYGTIEEIKVVAQREGIFQEFMKRDLAAVLECEMVALLPGWETSKGGLLEAFVAAYNGLMVFDYLGSAQVGKALTIYSLLVTIGESILAVEDAPVKGGNGKCSTSKGPYLIKS